MADADDILERRLLQHTREDVPTDEELSFKRTFLSGVLGTVLIAEVAGATYVYTEYALPHLVRVGEAGQRLLRMGDSYDVVATVKTVAEKRDTMEQRIIDYIKERPFSPEVPDYLLFIRNMERYINVRAELLPREPEQALPRGDSFNPIPWYERFAEVPTLIHKFFTKEEETGSVLGHTEYADDLAGILGMVEDRIARGWFEKDPKDLWSRVQTFNHLYMEDIRIEAAAAARDSTERRVEVPEPLPPDGLSYVDFVVPVAAALVTAALVQRYILTPTKRLLGH
ncbi:hypothetical protein GOV07_01560 [Candidatus Woesearchaeota archaeon]|nr:hypothetical protein [Candidatus Woesearchaeota archaeon]